MLGSKYVPGEGLKVGSQGQVTWLVLKIGSQGRSFRVLTKALFHEGEILFIIFFTFNNK
jgi:hypothetical protein